MTQGEFFENDGKPVDPNIIRIGTAIGSAKGTQALADALTEIRLDAEMGTLFSQPATPAASPAFYSKLAQVIEAKMPARASSDQIKGIINPEKGSGVKAEEIKWSGIIPWLEARKGATKEELLEYLRNEGAVRFEEVRLGDRSRSDKADQELHDFTYRTIEEFGGNQQAWPEQHQRWYQQLHEDAANAREAQNTEASGPAKFAQYQLHGGENYRETLEWALVDVGHDGDNSPLIIDTMHWSKDRAPKEPPPQGKRWALIGHFRTNERTDANGNTGLFMEEAQSGLHQKGRKKGYRDELDVRQDSASGWWLVFKDGERIASGKTKQDAIKNATEFSGTDAEGMIPDAPFRKDWPLAMFKRALRDAVEADKDWIGWTAGETQSDRYDLSKQVDSIEWFDKSEMLRAYKNGKTVISETGVTPERLPEFIGKETARKLLENSKVHFFNGYPNGRVHSLEGNDLKVGGEGMKGFYDQIIPKEVQKYVKQWGARVEKSTIDAVLLHAVHNENGEPIGSFKNREQAEAFASAAPGRILAPMEATPIWRVNITPAMREGIQTKGQALFSQAIRPATSTSLRDITGPTQFSNAVVVPPTFASDMQAQREFFTQQAKAAGFDSPDDAPNELIRQWSREWRAQHSRFDAAGSRLFSQPARTYESMEFSPPFESPFGNILSYHWVSTGDGYSGRAVSDWSQARTNPQTGRKIVHHFKVERPNGSRTTVSLETAMGALSKDRRGQLNALIKSEMDRRNDERAGQMRLFSQRAQAAQTLPDLTPEARESIVRRATQSLNAAAPDSVLGAGKQGASAGMDGRGPNMARVGVARNTPHGNQARSAINAAITDTRKAAESLGYGLRILDPTSVSDAQIKIDLKDSKARFSLAEGRILLVENFVDALPGVEAARRYLREELIHAAQLRVVDPAGSATTREAREALLLPVVNDIATELLQTEQGRGLLAASIGIYDGTKTIDPRLVEENIDGLSILELWRQLHQLRERSGLTEAGLNRVYKRIRQWMEQALRVLRKAAKQSPSPILDEAVQATVDLLNGRDSILSSQQPLTEQQVAGLSQRYNELFRMQRDGERLTPAQQRAMDQAEEALGQQLLFDIERLKGFAPAEQLTLQQQVDDTRVPSPDQLSLFSQKSAEREAAAGQMLLDFAQQQQETTTQANLTPEQTRLVTANMGIAGHAARRAALFYGWDRDDAMQEASIALAQAALTYDPARGARFSTYAFKVIANRLTSIGRGKGARAASNRAVRSISLNAPIAADDDTGLTRQDTIAGTVQPNETPERDEARALIAEAMAGVKPTARDILTRYAQGQTYDQIASDIGMTRQGVMMQAGRTADRLRRFFAERGVRSMDDLLPPQQERETPEAARKATPEDEQDTNMLDAREPDPERTTETQDDTDEALNSQPPARTVTADTARADLGRSHPSDERILTATGEMRTVADMAPQHKLSGSTGPTTITAVYPQADDQDVYTITTDGGRSVRASLDHLWLVLDTATGRTDTVTTMGLEPGRHMLPVIAR
jgi:RNA polymerase sigma factor (sigma-70 family)